MSETKQITEPKLITSEISHKLNNNQHLNPTVLYRNCKVRVPRQTQSELKVTGPTTQLSQFITCALILMIDRV